MNELIEIENKDQWLNLRSHDVTSTEVAALFGCSPYLTEFELWHRKRDPQVVEIKENERMKWGNRLEDTIANGIAEDNEWEIGPFKDYMRIPHLRMGSSFDYVIKERDHLLEIKNVDGLVFAKEWISDGEKNIEAPPHIELQVQHQLAVCGMEKAYIGALVGGNKVILIERSPQKEIIDAIQTKVSQFWASIDAGNEPNPIMERDAEFITKLYSFATPGKVVESYGNETFNIPASRYKEIAEQEKTLSVEKKAIKAEMLTMVGDAEKVLGDGFTVSASMIGPAQVSYERKGYRNFKVSWRKSK